MVVGGGGREHALAWKLAHSPECDNLFIAPGNGGTEQVGENVPIAVTDIGELAKFATQNSVCLTVVGPEQPLNLGIVDEFRERNLPIFGPTKSAAQIETSKAFSKNLMKQAGVPTAEFQSFDDVAEALEFAKGLDTPFWVKADGPDEGKGAEIATDQKKGQQIIQGMMLDGSHGEAGKIVVIERHLIGPEVSLTAICDGENYVMLPSSQDHKAFYDGGPNTGGLGAIAPFPTLKKNPGNKIAKQFVDPVLHAMHEAGTDYTGALYPGLKLTKDGPKGLEYNARFGDPETQAIMRLSSSDFLKILLAATEGRLDTVEPRWKGGYAAAVVLTSKGYPGRYETGFPIEGIEDAEELEDVVVFHAGTKLENDQLKTNGGRVATVTATAPRLPQAIKKAYEAVHKINFEGKNYHREIGKKAMMFARPNK